MEKTCNGCTSENALVNVPYVVHESMMARQERQIKRMWKALIISIILMFFTNMIWIGLFSSYDYSSTTEETIYTQDGQGTNIIGDSNNVNGSNADNPQEEAEKD